MGNTATRVRNRLGSPKKKATPKATKSATSFDGTFGKNPALNRADYIVSKQVDATIIKRPGSVNGQQFIIEDCTNCIVLLLDHCTSVQIDECHDCTIFIGPCTASLFVRNCSRTTLVCAVHQFRTRDCNDMEISLFSSTAPIIETSKNLRIGCFRMSYIGLQHHLEAGSFNIWGNKWCEIFDFTPAHGNWTPRSLGNSIGILEKCPPEVVEEYGFEESDLIIPSQHGLQARVDDQVIFCCMTTGDSIAALQFYSLGQKKSSLKLIQSRQFVVTSAQALELFGKQYPMHIKNAATCKDGIIVMEWNGPENEIFALLKDEFIEPHASTWYINASEGRSKVDLCWDTWKEVI